MPSTKRFKKLCRRLGFEITPVATMVDWKFTRRSDIETVIYHENFVMVVPRKMYATEYPHNDIGGRPLRNYWQAEHRLFQYKYGKQA